MLHLVNKSPYERKTLEACLRRAIPGSAILLYEDAVYAALSGTSVAEAISKATNAFDIYVLAPDLAARGFDPAAVVDGVQTIDYDGFVDLTIAERNVQSWL
jgi:tRNA 2-thiouridine synthesizing protein B